MNLRRRFLKFPRFGLKTLLFTTVMFSIVFGWIGHQKLEYDREQLAIVSMEKETGGIIRKRQSEFIPFSRRLS